MNRYPLWTYVLVALAVVLGLLYTLPNFFGEAPAVQVSSAKATLKADAAVLARVEEALKKKLDEILAQREVSALKLLDALASVHSTETSSLMSFSAS